MDSPHPAPRASDHDREDVVARLREAAADGRLDMTEFDERMTRAYAARTKPELEPLLSDLPDLSDQHGHHTSSAVGEPSGQIKGLLSSTQRRGVWEVPRQLRTGLVLASAHLDLTEATCPSQIQLDLSLVLASLEVVVPPGVRVDTSAVGNVLSSVNDRTRGAHSPVATVVVRGHATLSSVTFKTPNPITQWWRSVTTGT